MQIQVIRGSSPCHIENAFSKRWETEDREMGVEEKNTQP